MNELTEKVIQWAADRHILMKSNPEAQLDKTVEEVIELREAYESNDIEGIKNGIGDVLVTLTIQAKMMGWTLEECLEHAYNQIKDRKGKLGNGLFVKE